MANQYEKRKAKQKVEASENNQAEQVTPTYTHEAVDVVYNEDTRTFSKVLVSYNLVTGEAKVKETKAIADSIAVANYKMKEIFAKKLAYIK